MNDELKCPHCARTWGHLLPIEPRETAEEMATAPLIQLARNFVPTAKRSDERRVFSLVAEPQPLKVTRQTRLAQISQQKAFDDSYYLMSKDEQREVDELRADGVLRTPEEAAHDKAKRNQKDLITHNIIEFRECLSGFWIQCSCGRQSLYCQTTTSESSPQLGKDA